MEPMQPTDLPAVIACLSAALQQDVATRKPAEDALSAQEGRPGFCSCLAEVIARRDGSGGPANHPLPPEVRWLAAVCFKNAISRHWRPRRGGSGGGGVDDGERAHLRSRLVDLAAEETSPQITIQIALIVARVARSDYPRDWPQLLPGLLSRVSASGALLAVTTRVYLVLHHVIKELASKRLAADAAAFRELTAHLWPHVWAHWRVDAQSLTAGIPAVLADGAGLSAVDAVLAVCDRWRLALKCLRRLLTAGFPSDARTGDVSPAAADASLSWFASLEHLLSCWGHPALITGGGGPQLRSFLGRAATKLFKCASSAMESHPHAVVAGGALTAWLSLSIAVVRGGGDGTPAGDDVVVQAMRCVAAALRCPAYTPPAGGVHHGGSSVTRLEAPSHRGTEPPECAVPPAVAAAARAAALALYAALPPHAAEQLAVDVIDRYLALTPDDVDRWSRDPEGWHHEEDAATAVAESPRPAAASLLLALLECGRPPCGAALAARMGPLWSSPLAAGHTRADMARKEAGYAAAHAGAFYLHEHLDIGAWYVSALAGELADVRVEARPLRRRAAAVVGAWAPRLPATVRPSAYGALVSLLSERDAGVSLAAACALRCCVDDWAFDAAHFGPHASPCLSSLLSLVRTSAEFDSQLQALSLVVLLLSRLGGDVRHHAGLVLADLPSIWHAASSQPLLRLTVLQALARVVKALGRDSPCAHGIILPLLAAASDPNAPDAAALAEDALELWRSTLRYCPGGVGASSPLLAAFPALVAILCGPTGTEHLPLGVRAMESYALLGGAPFLASHAAAVASWVGAHLVTSSCRGQLLLLPAMELFILVGGTPVASAMAPSLDACLSMLLGTTGAPPGVAAPLTLRAAAGAVLQRTLLAAPDVFYGTVSRAAGGDPAVGGALLARVASSWLTTCDAGGGGRDKRKVAAAALLSLLPCRVAGAMSGLPQLLPWLLRLLHDLEGEHEGGGGDGGGWVQQATGWVEAAAAGDDDGEAESGRRLALHDADPVVKCALRAAAARQLAAARAAHGESEFVAACAAVDPDVLAALNHALGD